MSSPRSSLPGGTTALIVLPSLISGVGVAFVLTAILLNHQILQDIFLITGVVLLWLDFFVTTAIWRYSVRSIDRRLASIEVEMETSGVRPEHETVTRFRSAADDKAANGEASE